MSFTLSLRGLASRLFSRPTPTTAVVGTRAALVPQSNTIMPSSSAAAASYATAAPGSGRGGGKPSGKDLWVAAGAGRKSGKGKGPARDPRILNMLSHMAALTPRRLPAPLRMGRNRHLRHWTIHRAWLLFRRRQREARESRLMLQHQSMESACEALRLTEGPGTRDQGYLYRVAMEKKGVYGHHGIPIEYARAQVDTPPRVPWNHDWKA